MCGGCARGAGFKPSFEAAVVVVRGGSRLVLEDSGWSLAAVCRNVKEDVFDCRVGEDEAEEEEAEEVAAAVPGTLREVPGIAFE